MPPLISQLKEEAVSKLVDHVKSVQLHSFKITLQLNSPSSSSNRRRLKYLQQSMFGGAATGQDRLSFTKSFAKLPLPSSTTGGNSDLQRKNKS